MKIQCCTFLKKKRQRRVFEKASRSDKLEPKETQYALIKNSNSRLSAIPLCAQELEQTVANSLDSKCYKQKETFHLERKKKVEHIRIILFAPK